jgi:cell wall-associated NlpC family hydrolase
MKKWLVAIVAVVIICTQFASVALAVERYEVLMQGDRDDYVKELQQYLIDKGYLNTNATGYYGTNTTKAVIIYQQRHNLRADGKAGPVTRKAIMGDEYYEIPSTRFVSSDSSSDTSLDASASEEVDFESLCLGDEGDGVRQLQKRLKELGYYTYKNITSYFGPITKAAVILFQNENGLKADGVAGVSTQELLYSSGTKMYDSSSSSSTSNKTLGAAQAEAASAQTADAAAKCQKLIETAKTLIGVPYRAGGSTTSGFDCSGFVYYLLKQMNINPPRTSISLSQVSSWTKITNVSELRAGDLVFFASSGTSSTINHVGIYIGDGMFIHSSSGSAKGVTISDINSASYSARFRWGRRIWE